MKPDYIVHQSSTTRLVCFIAALVFTISIVAGCASDPIRIIDSRSSEGSKAPVDFFMFNASDSQLDWTNCAADTDPFCKQEKLKYPNMSATEIAKTYNNQFVDGMNHVYDTIGYKAVGGLIMNGDLTAYGEQHWGLRKFEEHYKDRLKMPFFIGLGNHDYENNVDNCSLHRWNHCATAMLHYLYDHYKGLKQLVSHHGEFYNRGVAGEGMRGSFAYAFDIGDVRFIQLNNHPFYTKSWTYGSGNKVDIVSSLAWLEIVLENAKADKKRIVFNFHNATLKFFNNNNLKRLLDKYAVSAMYGGHWHFTFGEVFTNEPPHKKPNFPVFISGSAHYGTFFVTRYKGDKMYVFKLKVDHFGDAKVRLIPPQGAPRLVDKANLFDVCSSCPRYYYKVYDLKSV